jgi:hypothetical protein
MGGGLTVTPTKAPLFCLDLFGFACFCLAPVRLPVVSAAARGGPRSQGVRSGAVLLAEACRLDGEVDLVLEARVLACGQQGRGFGDRAADGLDPTRLRFGEVIQDIIMDERLVAGMADADPHPLVAGADMGGDRAQAVVAGVAAADLDPHLARREIELVVDDDERAEVELRIAQSFADAASGIVHIGLRLEQNHTLIADQPVRHQSLVPGAKGAEPAPFGDRVNRHETDIVAVARVSSARIAESRNDQHGVPDRSA